MTLSTTVEDSLKEAQYSLRNALSYAARQERPLICFTISKLIQEIDNLTTFDSLLDKLEKKNPEDFGPFIR